MRGPRREPRPRGRPQDIWFENHDGTRYQPFATAHGNAKAPGELQDHELQKKRLKPYLDLIEKAERHAAMTTEEMKAVRDEDLDVLEERKVGMAPRPAPQRRVSSPTCQRGAQGVRVGMGWGGG